MGVIAKLSGTWKTILGGPATIAFLWILDLVTYYAGCRTCAWASAWTSYSWIQVVGFSMIAVGTLVYSGVGTSYYSLPESEESDLDSEGSESETVEATVDG